MKIMTFNLRTSQGEDGNNSWKYRADNVAKFIDNSGADLIGVQEGTPLMMSNLCTKMTSNYTIEGVGRLAGPEHRACGKISDLGRHFDFVDELVDFDEFNPILFNPDKYELLDRGVFWLSENPSVPRTLFVGQHPLLPRICTWIKLEEKESGKLILMFNTHLDHMNEDIRLKQIDVIIEHINELARQIPTAEVYLTGDFNTYPTGEVYARLMSSSLDLIDFTTSITKSFHDFGKESEEAGQKIDYIFTNRKLSDTDYKVESYVNAPDGSYLSDHVAITVELN